MSEPFSQVPNGLMMAEGVTLTALRTWHHLYVETLGRRAGWDFSYSQIAKAVGVSRRATVIDAVTWLCDNGWLIKVEQGTDKPNVYAVCREPFVGWADTTEVRPAVPSTPRRTSASTPDRTHQETTLLRNKETPLPPADPESLPLDDLPVQVVVAKRGKTPDPPGFAEFYDLYPRKVGRTDAVVAYAAARKRGVSAETIMAGLRAQHLELLAASKRVSPDTGWNLCPHPATWLNDERWANAPTERSQPARHPYAVPPDPPGWGFGGA